MTAQVFGCAPGAQNARANIIGNGGRTGKESEGKEMSTYKQFEDAAAACRNAQLSIEEILTALKPYEESAAVRAKTFGMISAAINILESSSADLEYCVNNLYKAIDEIT